MIKLISRLFPRSYRNNKGEFSLGGLNIGGGYGRSKSRTEEARPEFVQAPDYEEAEGARKSWWDRLQQWGASPSYGSVSPDWGKIWESGAGKIRDYYWGTATQPGQIGKVKASAARRGVSGQPAMEKEITKMAVSEAGDIKDYTTQQNVAQAQMMEQARMNWLKSLMGLAQVNPQGQWYTPWSTTNSSEWNVGGGVEGKFI